MPMFWCFFMLCGIVVVSVVAQDIIGCGGFVKSDVAIEFERIEVKLYTKQGAFKFKTSCAPNNGYFLVAVYDKGDYILKISPLSGWSFEPSDISLHIDGTTDPCSKGEDINFKFIGFTLSGKVLNAGKDVGPPGVLLSMAEKGVSEITATNYTGRDGSYLFERVKPGTYVVTASHPTWTLRNFEVEVKIEEDNVVVPQNILVDGYDVKGHVVSGAEPIQGVSFLIFSNEVQRNNLMGCKQFEPSSKFPNQDKALCFVESASDGKFVISSLPSGSYQLVPYYATEKIIFDIIPNKLDFSVGYASVVLKTPFQVYGFSVEGYVFDTLDHGIEGVVVTTKDSKGEIRKAQTDSHGMYTIDSIITGHYRFKAEKADHLFNDITMHITPNTPRLQDIRVEKYNVCGTIEVYHLPVGVLPIHHHKVLMSAKGTRNYSSVAPSNNGKFCFQATPGQYVIEVPLNEHEKQLGFLLTSSQMELEVSNQPILTANFQQFRASIKGTIKCLDMGCPEVSVHAVTALSQTAGKIVAEIERSGTEVVFAFTNMLPGKYKLVPQRKKWCWNPQSVEVEVVDNDINGIDLQQSGYFLKCHISHNITLNFTLENSEEVVGSFELKKGSNKFCLKQPGVYKLTPRSCYRFEQTSYTYNTDEPRSLTLNVDLYKITIKISSSKEVRDIKVVIKSLATQREIVLSPRVSDNGQYTYTIEHWGKFSEQFLVMPFSDSVLFYPDQSTVTVAEHCPGALAKFEAREGFFVEGKVKPELANVSVTITIQSETQEKRVIKTLTDQQGKYSVGPIHRGMQVQVQTQKDGYHIMQLTDYDFMAQKLAHIEVQVVNEKSVAMGGVLLSLSGGQFRNNNLTKANGVLSFEELSPGQYFLRPMHKEYTFEPASQMINITEGEDLVLSITGKRVAFSCTGSLALLSGSPQANVVIEAVGLHRCLDLHESATSDSTGKYRLSGLKPTCTYNVRLVAMENAFVERLAPANQLIQVQHEDLNDVNFVVFMKHTNFHISVSIETQQHHLLPSLQVMLYEEATNAFVQSITPGVLNYVTFRAVPSMVYVVKLQCSLSRKTYEYHTTSATITPDPHLTKKHVKLLFEAKETSLNVDPTQSVVALPLTVALVFAVYNYDSVIAFLLSLNIFLQSFNKAEGSEIKDDREEEVVGKKVKRTKKQR